MFIFLINESSSQNSSARTRVGVEKVQRKRPKIVGKRDKFCFPWHNPEQLESIGYNKRIAMIDWTWNSRRFPCALSTRIRIWKYHNCVDNIELFNDYSRRSCRFFNNNIKYLFKMYCKAINCDWTGRKKSFYLISPTARSIVIYNQFIVYTLEKSK